MIPLSISPAPPANPGLDYAALKAEGIALLQELSGEVWTDYNESDPGVTILEQLCYALTELSYRAGFPMADLLADPRTGRIDARRQALVPAPRIFPGNPLTLDDYRKLLLDRVPEVANAWLEPHRRHLPSRCERFVDGLYDITLYVRPRDGGPPPDEDAIRERVRRVYCRHRSLCEDIRAIRILRPAAVTVHAEVELAEVRTADAILADLLFRLGNLFAPEPRRAPLSELLAAGRPPADIFSGPRLRHGFIADGELTPRAASFSRQEIWRAMAGTPGVASVRQVKARVAGQGGPGIGPVAVPRGAILCLETRPDGRRGFPIRLFKNGVEVKPDPARVERELARRWAEQRRTWDLPAQCAEAFALPRGERRDLERYTSIQYQFPEVYGIGSCGLPAGVPAGRRAAARQLKGYLLVFDQLMANFFAQLAHARDLFSLDRDLRHTYFFQGLDAIVPHILPLLEPDYPLGLTELVGSQDPFIERRNRFLDVLLALYAEELGADAVWGTASRDVDDGEILLAAKLALLRRLRAITRDRGRGFDYLEPPAARNVAGLVPKSLIELGGPGGPRGPHLAIVEHVLLRFGRFRQHHPDFPYSFTITAVLTPPADLADDRDWRAFARRVVRRNTPSHVAIEYCFLPRGSTCCFGELAGDLERARRQGGRREIARAAAQLRGFLEQHRQEGR